jgi:hypothetical protein
VLRTTERIIGDDSPTGLKLPHKATLRTLLFKYQIGAVMGKKGAAINEIRNKSGATVKLTTPQPGAPIVPCAEKDDELITVSFISWFCVCYSWILLCSCARWALDQCHAAGRHACIRRAQHAQDRSLLQRAAALCCVLCYGYDVTKALACTCQSLLGSPFTSALLHRISQVSGTSEQVVGAVRMITEKLRAVLGLGAAAGCCPDICFAASHHAGVRHI